MLGAGRDEKSPEGDRRCCRQKYFRGRPKGTRDVLGWRPGAGHQLVAGRLVARRMVGHQSDDGARTVPRPPGRSPRAQASIHRSAVLRQRPDRGHARRFRRARARVFTVKTVVVPSACERSDPWKTTRDPKLACKDA